MDMFGVLLLHLNIIRCLNPPQTIQHFVHPPPPPGMSMQKGNSLSKSRFSWGRGKVSTKHLWPAALCAYRLQWLAVAKSCQKQREKAKIMCDRRCPRPTDSLLVASDSSCRSQAGEWAFGMLSHDHGANVPCWSCGGWPQVLPPSLTMWENKFAHGEAGVSVYVY